MRASFHAAAAAGAGISDHRLSILQNNIRKETLLHTGAAAPAGVAVHPDRQAGKLLAGAPQGRAPILQIRAIQAVGVVAVTDEHEIMESRLKSDRINPHMRDVGDQARFGGAIHMAEGFLFGGHSSVAGMNPANGRTQRHAPDILRRRRNFVVPSADAFVEDEQLVHIRQKSFDDAAGHRDVFGALDLNIEGDGVHFIIWPHEKRINQPFQEGEIAEPFARLHDRPRKPDGLPDEIPAGAVLQV